MSPITVSAQLAAFVWFTKGRSCTPNAAATRFARENWRAFLPLAHPGLGKLLIRIAGRRPRKRRRAAHSKAAASLAPPSIGQPFSIN